MKHAQKLTGLIFLIVAFSSLNATSQNRSGLHIVKKYAIKSNGGWDYVTVDAGSKKIYVSHGSQVNILSTVTGDSLGIIRNTNGVHGIALVKPLGKGYTSNGKDNSCTVST